MLLLSACHFSVFVHLFFFFTDPATTEIYTLSLHDALPISRLWQRENQLGPGPYRKQVRMKPISRTTGVVQGGILTSRRSEEHTSELQSHVNLVCRLLLEKKKKKQSKNHHDISVHAVVVSPE